MKKLSTLFLVLFISVASMAQQNLVVYNMKTLPQRQYANPAMNPDARFYIGIPGISSTYINSSFTAFTISDLRTAIEAAPDGAKVLNVNKLGDILGAPNYMKLNTDAELISFGFKLKKNFFYANSTLRNQFRFQYPEDLLRFALQGNGGNNLGKTFNFGFGLDVLQYLETGIGWSREFTDKLTIGVRAKYYQGINNLSVETMDLNFRTDPNDYSWLLSADVKVNAATSIGGIQLPDTFPNGLAFEGAENIRFPFKNYGFGMDLGTRYKLSKKLTLSASLVDLGYIDWKESSYTFQSKNPKREFRFEGVEIDNFFNDSMAWERSFEQLGDTLLDQFNLQSTEEQYITRMFSEFYLGANLNIFKNHNAGLLFYGSWYNKKLYPAFTVSWNSKIRRILGVSVAWSYMNRSFANLGAGLSINAGPVQFYVVSDNLYSPIRPVNTRSIDLRFGMNITALRKAKGDTGEE